jgi:hypothetical protein
MLIDRWSLRLIAVGTDTIRIDTKDQIRVWYRVAENGGELARARWSAGSTWRGSLGTLRIAARRADGSPAAGTVVRFPETHYRGVANADGVIEISDLVPGPYIVSILDARLTPLGIEIPTPLKFVAERDSTVRASIVARSATDFVIDRCVKDRKYAPSDSVLLVGRVVDAYGQPLAGISIALAEVVSATEEKRLPDVYTTGDDGVFTVCSKSLRRGMTLAVYARRGGSTLWTDRVRLDENLSVLRAPVGARK